MPTTANYSWPTPANTDYVKDGASAMRSLGNAIDTTMATMVPKSLVDAAGDLIIGTANDTVGRLAIGANTTVLTSNGTTATWATPATSAMNRIGITTLGSSAADITFSSIAGTYSSLRLVIYARGAVAATGDTLLLRFNGDTGNNYDAQYILGDLTSVSANKVTGSSSITLGSIPASSATAGSFGVAEIVIPNYAVSSRWRAVVGTVGANLATGTDLKIRTTQGWWRNSANAVTSVTVLAASGNLDTGTVVALYGVN